MTEATWRERVAARRSMIALSAVLVAAQLADTVWPRADERAGSPASFVFSAALAFLLAVYPNGRSVPRWMIGVAVLDVALFAASDVAGPDVAERWLWPLPIAPFLLMLVIGGQGYRYWRRSNAAEREAVRWPLLGALLLLTIVLPADLISVALTGSPIENPPPVLTAIVQIGFLLPGAGFLVGLLAPRTDLVDRLLAGWVTVVVAGIALGAVFVGVFLLLGQWLSPPWPAVAAAAAVVIAGVWILPLARRAGQRVVFRGRSELQSGLAALARRLRTTLDSSEIPVHLVESVREATGSAGVVLRRSGRLGVWAQAGQAPTDSEAGGHETVIRHLGLPVATLTVWPRPAESELAATDVRVIEGLASAAAPALHGARLAVAFPELTERERQVLAGITRGLPNAAIAARLGVSGKTVANYVSIVLTKLRVPDKERAAELARRRAAELG